MQESGFEKVDAYVVMRQNMAPQYIATQPILEIYKETVRRPGTWVEKIGGVRRDWTWWD